MQMRKYYYNYKCLTNVEKTGNTRSFHIREDIYSNPPSPTLTPSTPRKTKGLSQTAMTVSVNHAQQMTITTSLSSASTTSLSSSSSTSNSAHQSFQQHHNHAGAFTTTTNATTSRDASIDRPSSPNSSGSDTDPIITSSSTTALRRLYFKTGRNAKTKTPNTTIVTSTPLNCLPQTNVSKVTIKGSTTHVPPETTINTSTESASTMLTNITATDTETCDSLDLAELSGQNEPLLLSSLDESSNSEILNSIQSNSYGGMLEENNSIVERDPPILINYDDRVKISSDRKSPNTAPVASSTYFIFDQPSSPKSVQIYQKNQSKFTFEETSNSLHSQFNDKLLNLEYEYHHNDRDIELKENKKRKDDCSRYIEKDNYLHKNITKFDRHGDRNSAIEDKKPKRSPSNKSGSKKLSNNNKVAIIDDYDNKKEKYDNSNIVSSATEDKYYFKQKNIKSNEFENSTLFPFDREAIDYELIQRECFAVEDEPRLKFDFDTNLVIYDPDSPTQDHPEDFDSPSKCSNVETYDTKNDIFYQYQLLAQQEQNYSLRGPSKRNRSSDVHHKPVHHISKIDAAFSPKPTEKKLQYQSIHTSLQQSVSKFDQIVSKFDQIPPKYYDQSFYQETELLENNSSSTEPHTTQLPNLRIDFFSEPIMTSTTNSNTTSVTNKLCATSSSSAVDNQLDSCQKLTHSVGSINVTPNPMDTAVCTQPRATIVVQQASLSLDNTVETYLLRNDGDFISVEQGKGSKKKKQREENMQQLLDVTNTFTSEELRDFENRYGSPHHSRSQSVKTPGSRSSGRPNQLTLPSQRSRVASMPNTGVEEEYYRLRHFSITGKGIVNRGDSLKSRRSRSNNSVASSNSSNEHLTAIPCTSAKTSATCSLASSRESSTSNPGNGPYRVLMLGGAAVGKSSLVSQFMTSEYLHAYDTSIDDESGEKAVSVLLSGEESELVFIDHSFTEMSPENCLSSYEPHGYCVIYSSSDRSSFIIAERVLQVLWQSENIAQKAVILVANKADLARSRAVSSEEGKGMAIAYDCKFIETSVGINHNVDELLVGLLSQIRLKLENPEKSRDLFRKRSSRKSKRRACSPLGGAATACLTGAGTNPSTPVTTAPTTITTNISSSEFNTPPGSLHSSPRKYRGSRTSASLKVKGLLGRVWARDSKSKSCENLHVL